MMNVFPINDRVVIRPLETPDVTPGGIVLPDAAKEKPTRGEVVAVGPGKPFGIHEKSWETGRLEMRIYPGDMVLYGKYAGTAIEVDDEELVVLREDDILVKLGA